MSMIVAGLEGRRRLLGFAALVLLAQCGMALAQAIAVPSLEKSSTPTMTFLFRAPEAKATLLFIPGGEGRRGIQPDWKETHGYFTKYEFNVMLRSLSDPQVTSGSFDVVIFDNPTDLPVQRHWSAARTSAEHLARIEDVVRYYREKLGRPIWLMGHSMGSISVTEFYKRLQSKKSEDLVAALIISGGENGTSLLYEATKLPVLLLHHERDECVGNPLSHAQRLQGRLKDSGNPAAELFIVMGGAPAPQDPCRSGYHMYLGAASDAARGIDQFARKYLQTK
jgi:dienelactone hydrolase